jgi:hypothetical protein
MEDILHQARAAVTMGGGSEAKTMTAILNEENVVEEREHVVDKQTREGGASQAAPDQPPGKVGQAGLNLGGGGGQSGSKLPINEPGRDIQQGCRVDSRQGEDLLQEAGEVLVKGGNVLSMEASPQIRKEVAKAEPHPIGNVAGGPAAPRQAVTCLLS